MNIEEIKERLTRYRNTRTIMTEQLENLDVGLAELEKQLAEAEEAKLRPWDYGMNTAEEVWIRLDGDVAVYLQGHFAISHHNDKYFIPQRLGNLIDDIKALSADMTEYKWHNGTYDAVRLTLANDGRISMEIGSSVTCVTSEDVESLALALRQIAATAKRRAGK